eukprot:363696-Chlamydomonas_euryale.AAC.16
MERWRGHRRHHVAHVTDEKWVAAGVHLVVACSSTEAGGKARGGVKATEMGDEGGKEKRLVCLPSYARKRQYKAAISPGYVG